MPTADNDEELQDLIRDFLKQGIAFAHEYVTLTGLKGDAATVVEATIIARCGRIISEVECIRCDLQPKSNDKKLY